jgi:hypothetical protein
MCSALGCSLAQSVHILFFQSGICKGHRNMVLHELLGGTLKFGQKYSYLEQWRQGQYKKRLNISYISVLQTKYYHKDFMHGGV